MIWQVAQMLGDTKKVNHHEADSPHFTISLDAMKLAAEISYPKMFVYIDSLYYSLGILDNFSVSAFPDLHTECPGVHWTEELEMLRGKPWRLWGMCMLIITAGLSV
jgi:hypothetical protein